MLFVAAYDALLSKYVVGSYPCHSVKIRGQGFCVYELRKHFV
jgi:hypothetical protein